jgi:hypothetical protein
MFDIVYIILAFDNPKQIKRLVNSLNAEGVNFYIHVDLKVDQSPFEFELQEFSNLKFVNSNERKEISWGDNKMVKAILNLMKMVKENHKTGYCVLLSNNDYPIKSNTEIRSYFSKNFGASFMSISKFDKNSYLYNQRLKHYKFELSKKRQDMLTIPSIWEKDFYRKSSFGAIIKVLKSKQKNSLIKIFKKRQEPVGIESFLGSSWWAIPIEVMDEILNFCDSNTRFVKYHEETFISDEIFFPTILKHLDKNGKIETKILGRVVYLEFKNNESSPIDFRASDFDKLVELPERFLFVRKLNTKIDETIFNLIDNSRSAS